jgi:hypothetical protein
VARLAENPKSMFSCLDGGHDDVPPVMEVIHWSL